jgi:hypothetical protein
MRFRRQWWLMVSLLAMAAGGCWSPARRDSHPKMQAIKLAEDGRSFILAHSKSPFVPWGHNYGNGGRLMEDFWEDEWQTLAEDFREMRALGANVVRVHLQFGKFMTSAQEANAKALAKLGQLVKLAERNRLYLDVTGLACYRKADVPPWYDGLDEQARWSAQAVFWEAVARQCAPSPAIFCYDLMNEPISPAAARKPGGWYSGHLFGGYDFLQYITVNPAGRKREEIVSAWIDRMTAAIRKHDRAHLITVGMLPWTQELKHLSGFVPSDVAPHVDFLSVHIYPNSKKLDEAREALGQCDVGKAVVIEETFPLTCSSAELEDFLKESRKIACGWIGHYDGTTIEEYDALEAKKEITKAQLLWHDWLRLFGKMKGEMARK